LLDGFYLNGIELDSLYHNRRKVLIDHSHVCVYTAEDYKL